MTAAPRDNAVRGWLLRALGGVAALALVAVLWRSFGGADARAALSRARWALLVAMALEALVVASNGLAQRALLRAAGRDAPPRALWRAVLVGHIAAVSLPAGRLLAEAWKATQLAPHVGAPVAAASAVALQAGVLYANAVVACVTAGAVAHRCGWTAPTWAVMAFAGLMTLVASAIASAGRAEAGRRLGSRFAAARDAGPAFDAAFASVGPGLGAAVAWECVGRALQCVQVGVIRAAVGVPTDVPSALATYGLLLTGAALGDFLPAQLGATDAALTLAAGPLGMRASDGLALALTLHAAQVGAAAILAAVAWRSLRR